MKPLPVRDLTKEAGIPGLGMIPPDWESVALRHLLEFENGQVDPRVKPYSNALLVAPNHIESGTGVLLEKETAAEQGAISGKYRVRAGDIIYSKIRPALRKVTVSKEPCLCSADMYALRPIGRGEPRFFFWSLLSDYFSTTVVLESDRVAMPKVNRESLGAIRLLRPPLDEQTQIARFLDYETAKIDQLIDKQQQLIALLKEKRQAVISHAVTKGLNPDARMKDSGIEWLGKVPAHWDVAPLKRFVVLQRGHDLPTEQRREGRYPVMSSAGQIGTHDDFRCRGPGIVTGRYGTIGDFYLQEQDFWPLNTSLYSIELYGNDARYLRYMLSNMKHLFVLNSLKSAVPGVDRNDVHSEHVAAPRDRVEQERVADYLDQRMARFAGIIGKANEQIDLLQERRTALISAAVTGKIDVRNWKPPETEVTQEVA